MYKFLLFLISLFLGFNLCIASDDIFSHPNTSRYIAKQMPELKDVSCKFTQEKYIGTAVLKSGGNFQFVKKKGAIFETLYPIKSTVSLNMSFLLWRAFGGKMAWMAWIIAISRHSIGFLLFGCQTL